MIRIDLLPPEYRRAEKTAPAVFLATMGLVAFATMAAFGGGYAWFSLVEKAKGEVQIAKEDLANLKPTADYSDRLEVEKKEFSARLTQIKEFSDSRVLWTKKIDLLASLVDTPPASTPNTGWFESLDMDMDTGRKMGLKLKGYSESGEIRKVSNIHATLKGNAEFFDGFVGISNPAAKVVIDDGFDPMESCEFEFSLELFDKSLDGKKNKKGARGRSARR